MAGNYREFVNWCRDMRLSPHDPLLYYVRDFSRLMGHQIDESKGDRVVFYGTYAGRMDWAHMVEELRVRWRD